MELGIISLSDLKTSLDTGQRVGVAERIADTIGYAVLADRLGLDLSGGRHRPSDQRKRRPLVTRLAD